MPMLRKLRSILLNGIAEDFLQAEIAKQFLMRTKFAIVPWKLHTEDFDEKIFYQDIREYRKQSLRPNQTNESSRSKQFDPRY